MAKLTEKQKRFVEEYLIDLNATQAAIRSGYSRRNADKIGSELLGKTGVSEYLHRRQAQLQAKTGITQERVLEELASIGFAQGTDYAQINQNGHITLTPTEALNDRQRAAVIGIKETQAGVEVKLADKLRALELLGKHLGMFAEGAATPKRDSGLLEALQNSAKEVWEDVSEIQLEADAGDDLVGASGNRREV